MRHLSEKSSAAFGVVDVELAHCLVERPEKERGAVLRQGRHDGPQLVRSQFPRRLDCACRCNDGWEAKCEDETHETDPYKQESHFLPASASTCDPAIKSRTKA